MPITISGISVNLVARLACFGFIIILCHLKIADARRKPLSSALLKRQMMKQFKHISDYNMDSSIAQPYANGVGSPLTIPPYDSLSPTSLPDQINSPPYCVFPSPSGPYGPIPITPVLGPPDPPPILVPSPIMPGMGSAGPPGGFVPNPITPEMGPPGPPSGFVPSPTMPVMGPPGPSSGFVPSPSMFLPPIVYPPPVVPPPPHRGPTTALWCVAKPSVPDPIIQEAMNYACGSGADCDSVMPNRPCFQPNTLLAHASYAFNSYWQRTKVTGGTCEFGGTAILVTVDPSYDGCHFLYF